MGGLTGVSALVWLERDRRRPDVGAAFLGVHRHPLGAGYRLLRRPRQLGLAADDAAVLAAAAPAAAAGRAYAGAAAHRRTGVMQLVLVVERLQREATMSLLASASSLGDVRVVLPHRLRLVNLQLSVKSLEFALKHAASHASRFAQRANSVNSSAASHNTHKLSLKLKVNVIEKKRKQFCFKLLAKSVCLSVCPRKQ